MWIECVDSIKWLTMPDIVAYCCSASSCFLHSALGPRRRSSQSSHVWIHSSFLRYEYVDTENIECNLCNQNRANQLGILLGPYAPHESLIWFRHWFSVAIHGAFEATLQTSEMTAVREFCCEHLVNWCLLGHYSYFKHLSGMSKSLNESAKGKQLNRDMERRRAGSLWP